MIGKVLIGFGITFGVLVLCMGLFVLLVLSTNKPQETTKKYYKARSGLPGKL